MFNQSVQNVYIHFSVHHPIERSFGKPRHRHVNVARLLKRGQPQQIIRRYVKFRSDSDQNIAADGFGFTAFDAAELGRGYADPFGKVLLCDKRGLAQIPDALPRRFSFCQCEFLQISDLV